MSDAEDRKTVLLTRVRALAARRAGALRGLNPFGVVPIDLRIAGRTLAHASLVGAVAGLLGTAFFAALEVGQRLLLEGLAGFTPLRAAGETVVAPHGAPVFRWWVLALLPAAGALASGVLTTWLAPEAEGGGGDAAIDAYHHGGVVRRRVVPVKGIAAVLTLSSGGSGGREGPTMQIGAAIGAAVGRLLPTTAAERRVLLVAGIAAGIAAVFRTPLGAALLATELLYRDDFEAEALVPSVFASVVSYSVATLILGEVTLFGALPRFRFTPRHLPLYALLAVATSIVAAVFVRALRAVQRATRRTGLPRWLRPAIGGLAMGCLGTAAAAWMASRYGAPARSFGAFGGGYGVLQVAISGADWLPGRHVALVLLALGALKLVASALTIGSGAAAGDFAPSLVIGGLVGSAFGHAAQELLHDPGLHPGAFALVGMGTFYGGLAHSPLAALVLVAELAGSYDLLVPMMLAVGVAYVALRRHSLYPAQRPTRLEAVRLEPRLEREAASAFTARSVGESALPSELPAFAEETPLAAVAARTAGARRQHVIEVTTARGARALAELSVLEEVPAAERTWMRIGDATVPFASVTADATWGEVTDVLVARGLSQVPVVRGAEIVGWVGLDELRAALEATASPP